MYLMGVTLVVLRMSSLRFPIICVCAYVCTRMCVGEMDVGSVVYFAEDGDS